MTSPPRRIYLACGLAIVAMLGSASVATAQKPNPRESQDLRQYVTWLEQQSMLYQAKAQARQISGRGVQWQHRYGEPRPREAVEQASVWLLDYPDSVIAAPGQSVLGAWSQPEFWDALEKVGIKLLHIGPVRKSGSLVGRKFHPSIDGRFDPISLEIDPDLGTEDEYRRMVKVAAQHQALIAGDLIPLHTGIGADFRLAQLAYKDYPGMYTMVEINEQDWDLLPAVEKAWGSAKVPKPAARELHRRGYLPGLINSNDAAKDAKEWTGWSCSGKVEGSDGVTRRWVYLHYFKPGQPALNWLDPSYAAQRAMGGDIVKSVHTLGTRVMRLDAVPFLGIEPQPGEELTLHFLHPRSVNATNELASLVRKLGGYSFQELNVPLAQFKTFAEKGPDLSYDFFTRAQSLHALLTGDAALLRQAYEFLLEADVELVSLVHDLQNHDEITYQLVELAARQDEKFTIAGRERTGRELRDDMLEQMREKVARNPRNKLYRPERDGIATTFPGFVAACVGVEDPEQATDDEIDAIKRGHLLLTVANALQPGVFSLSSWDLVGALPVPEESVKERLADDDYRWVNRGAVDLLGNNRAAKASPAGVPRAPSLYGSLTQQLRDEDSFASHLRRILAAREQYEIATGELIAVPEVENRSVCVLVLRTGDASNLAITALNFGREGVAETIDLSALRDVEWKKHVDQPIVDILSGETVARLGRDGHVRVELKPLSGSTFVIAAKE